MTFELPDGYVIARALGDAQYAPTESHPTLQEAVDTILALNIVPPGANRYDERVCPHGIRLQFDPSDWRVVLYLNGVPNGEAWQVDCDGTANPI